MKVLWLFNFLPPAIARALDFPVQASGSWVMALYHALQRNPEGRPEILLCGCSDQVAATLREDIDNTTYYAIPKRFGETALEELIAKEKPDYIQLFGTEGEHAQWCFNLFDPEKILVYIQGLARPCGEHMADGLPESFLRRQPLKEALANQTGGLTVYQQQQKLLNQGSAEIQLLKRARHVLGRTQWDHDYCLTANPDLKYYQLNEIMRPSFYDGGWSRDHCQPHRIFVSQGNLPLKGFHRAIEALPSLCERWPDTQLYVAGWPPPDKGPLLRPFLHWLAEYSGYLAQLAARLNVDRHIHYTGVLDETGMRQQMMAAETFLLCSSVENSPNSLGEAMLMGLPCAVSRVGGVPSLVDEHQASLFDPDVPGALAQAIASLWEDSYTADKMARSAYLRARDTHDPAQIARAQVKIYNEIAGL